MNLYMGYYYLINPIINLLLLIFELQADIGFGIAERSLEKADDGEYIYI